MTQEYVTVRLDWVWHPKVIGLSLAARGLWISGLCYAASHDGFVPDVALRGLTSGGDLREIAASRKQLVANKLWDRVEDGYEIHDFSEHCAWLVNRRLRDRERQQKRRSALKLSRDMSVTVTQERGTENREQERRTLTTPKPPSYEMSEMSQKALAMARRMTPSYD